MASTSLLSAVRSTFFRLSQHNQRYLSCTASRHNISEVFKLGSLDHVAIATPNMDKSAAFYRDVLGAKSVSKSHPQPEHGVSTVFVDLGNAKIELLHPLGEHSPIANFLKKNKNGGMHHICIEVKNIESAMKILSSRKIRCLSEKPSIGAHGKPVIFLHPKDCSGVLIELEEE